MKWKPRLALVALGLAILGYGNALWIYAKAELAQWLIADAWSATLESDAWHKPWDWADTWPVARLQHSQSNTDLLVLEGAQGNALAFGPGHQQGTSLPGHPGASLIGGHRDTHFRFLREVQLRDELLVQNSEGIWRRYRIESIEIHDTSEQRLMVNSVLNQLILVTCYPFDAITPGGPLRYVVIAERIEPTKPYARNPVAYSI